jgi:micrococcal nuclease
VRTFRFWMIVFTVIMMLDLNAMSSYAHNGDRDELGGHFRNKDCMYLLHDPTTLAKSAQNIQEVILLIQQYNSNDCKNSLTANMVDLEGYLFEAGTSSSPNHSSAEAKPASSTIELGQRYIAALEKCVDGDTAVFSINGTSYSTRFLFIDTPESTTKKEAFGKEASEFTCSFLKDGKITLETDGNTLFDKYDRLLAWVFVDDNLHQEEITTAGLVEDFYDYGDYKYEDRVREAMTQAKANAVGIYSEADDKEGFPLYLVGIVFIIFMLFSILRKLG